MDNTEIEQSVINVLQDRWKKGRETYGEGLYTRQGSVSDWLNNAIEECADQLQYLVAMRIKMKDYFRYGDDSSVNDLLPR